MKKLVTLLALTLTLSGCASINQLIESYRMAKFDNNEYALVANIRTQAQVGAGKCGTPAVVPVVDELYTKSLELKNYSAHIPHNQETVTMTVELAGITKGLYDRYHSGDSVSTTYCNLKFGNIDGATETMQKVIGAKPR